MTNIKATYWIPGLGVAFIMNDSQSILNAREERAMLLYHGLMVCLLILGGLCLLLQPGIG